MYQSLKNKNIKLNNSISADDQVFDSMNTMTLLKDDDDDEPCEKFMSFYHSENRLASNNHEDPFYKDFKAFLEKNQKQ